MITIAPADDLFIVRELITEYANSLGVDLSFQDLDRELATLDSFYELILLASIRRCSAPIRSITAKAVIDDRTGPVRPKPRSSAGDRNGRHSQLPHRGGER